MDQPHLIIVNPTFSGILVFWALSDCFRKLLLKAFLLKMAVSADSRKTTEVRC